MFTKLENVNPRVPVSNEKMTSSSSSTALVLHELVINNASAPINATVFLQRAREILADPNNPSSQLFAYVYDFIEGDLQQAMITAFNVQYYRQYPVIMAMLNYQVAQHPTVDKKQKAHLLIRSFYNALLCEDESTIEKCLNQLVLTNEFNIILNYAANRTNQRDNPIWCASLYVVLSKIIELRDNKNPELPRPQLYNHYIHFAIRCYVAGKQISEAYRLASLLLKQNQFNDDILLVQAKDSRNMLTEPLYSAVLYEAVRDHYLSEIRANNIKGQLKFNSSIRYDNQKQSYTFDVAVEGNFEHIKRYQALTFKTILCYVIAEEWVCAHECALQLLQIQDDIHQNSCIRAMIVEAECENNKVDTPAYSFILYVAVIRHQISTLTQSSEDRRMDNKLFLNFKSSIPLFIQLNQEGLLLGLFSEYLLQTGSTKLIEKLLSAARSNDLLNKLASKPDLLSQHPAIEKEITKALLKHKEGLDQEKEVKQLSTCTRA